MNKIEKLTKEQEALIPIVKDEWIDKLTNLKLNKTQAKESIEWLYEFCKLPKPNILFLSSPMACQLAANLIQRIYKNQDQVWDQVRAQVRAQVRDQVGAQVWDQVRAQVRDQVRAQVRAQVRVQVGDLELEFLFFSNYGNISDYSWLAFYDYFRKIGVNINHNNFDKFNQLINSGICDMIQLKNWCFVCENPTSIYRDDRGRLHAEDKAAIKWADGYKLYFLSGIAVNEKIVLNPEAITIKDIQSERNLELRRILTQRFGVDKYLGEINAEVIDVDFRGVEGAGARALMREPNSNQWLVATDGSTNRVYHLFVPSTVQTCKQAHEALCGFSESLVKMEG